MTGLEALFLEVVALAHQLRKTDFRAQERNGLLAAGRKVLQLLNQEGPKAVPAIAARQNSSRQNVQIIANRFAREGLIQFIPNPAHKKSELLEITNEGQKVLAASAELETEVLKKFAVELKDSELNTAIDVLRRVTQELASKQSSLLASQPRRKKSASREKHPPAARLEKIGEDEDAFPVNLL